MKLDHFLVNGITTMSPYTFLKSFLLTILLAFPLITGAQSPSNRLLIENVNVIPLHLSGVLEGKDVVLENGSIVRMRKHVENDTTVYDLGRVDGKGKYLIPALADAHIHLPEKEDLERFFLMNLMNGVTTLRSMRGEEWHLEIDKDAPFTPNLILSAPPITRRDSSSAEDLDVQIGKYNRLGFEFIKLLSVRDQEHFDQLINSAKKHNMKVAGHCPNNVDTKEFLSSGQILSIEHLGGLFAQPDFKSLSEVISLTVAQQVYHCPTLDWYSLGQYEAGELRQRDGIKYLSNTLVKEWEDEIAKDEAETPAKEAAEYREKVAKSFTARLSYLTYIYEQGIKLLLSPDASGTYSIPGFGMHTEMDYYAQAGISPVDILKATSYNLSEMQGELDQWGSIRVGMKSDMVLLSQNPLEDIANAKEIEGIVLKGKFYSIEVFEEALEKLGN